jgi:hypothetical protein
VIHGRARQVPRVHWTFAHTPRPPAPKKGESAGRKKPQDEPELPL